MGLKSWRTTGQFLIARLLTTGQYQPMSSSLSLLVQHLQARWLCWDSIDVANIEIRDRIVAQMFYPGPLEPL